jgi:SSS family solute:Na+ symporter
LNKMQIGMVIIILIFTLAGSLTYFLVRRSGKRFIVAGKSLPFFIIGTMLFAQATEANGTLGGAAFAYGGGFWQGWVLSGGVGACLIITGMFYAKPMNRMNLITLPDFFFRRYNRVAEILVSIISIIGFTLMDAGCIAGAGMIISWIFPITLVQGMIIMAAVVFLYTMCGGIFSCAATDILQLYPAFIAFVGSVIWLISKYGWDFFSVAIPANFLDFSAMTTMQGGALIFWSSFISMALGDIVALDFMERIFSADSPKTASYGCYWGGTFTIIIAVCVGMLGVMGLALFPDIADPRNILPTLATDILPFFLGLFLLAGIIGAGLSTANGGLLAVCAVIARNILQRNVLRTKRQDMNEEEREKFDIWLLKATRLVGIPVMAITVTLAYFKPEPGVMLVLAFDTLLAACFVPLTLGLFWKKANSAGAVAAILVGAITRLIGYIITPVEWIGIDTLIPPVLSLITMVSVSLMTQESSVPKHHVISEIPSDEQVLSGEA